MLCSLLICVVTAHVLLYYVSQLSKYVPYELWVVGNTRETYCFYAPKAVAWVTLCRDWSAHHCLHLARIIAIRVDS